MLGHIVGSYDLDRVLASGDLIRVARLVSSGSGSDPAGRADQERAISVSFLVSARDGGANAGFGLSAFGDDGEGRRFFAGPSVAGDGGN